MTRSAARLRTLACAALATAALSALAACGESGLGAAARVGDVRISHEAVASRVERGYVGPVTRQAERTDLQRLWVGQLVKRPLFAEAARRLGVLPSDADLAKMVDEFIASQGGAETVEQRYAGEFGVHRDDVRTVIETNILLEIVADKLVEGVETPEAELRKAYTENLAQFDQAVVAHIKVKDRATADRVLAQARGGADFAKLAEQSLDPATAPRGGVLGVIGNGAGQYDPNIVRQVFASKPNALLGPFRLPDGTWDVWKVIDRRTTTFEQARDELRRNALGERRQKAAFDYVNKLGREMGLSVNPRYGRWDEARFSVVATEDGLSRPEPTAGVQGPAGAGPGSGPAGSVPGQ